MRERHGRRQNNHGLDPGTLRRLERATELLSPPERNRFRLDLGRMRHAFRGLELSTRDLRIPHDGEPLEAWDRFDQQLVPRRGQPARPRGARGPSHRRVRPSTARRNTQARSMIRAPRIVRRKEGPMSNNADLFETMQTMRAMRRLKPDQVPDALIKKILQAGVCAPNGGNTQRWRFLVIKDTKIKQGVQVWYKRAFDEVVGPRYLKSAPPPGVTREQYNRQHGAVEYLTDHFHEAPVWIVACLEEGSTTPTRSSGASIYPAVQNMLLAARALGLGATLTTRHLLYEKEAEAALGLPTGVHSYAILPIGYPMGKFGPVGRGPLKEIVFQDRWGTPYQGV